MDFVHYCCKVTKKNAVGGNTLFAYPKKTKNIVCLSFYARWKGAVKNKKGGKNYEKGVLHAVYDVGGFVPRRYRKNFDRQRFHAERNAKLSNE